MGVTEIILLNQWQVNQVGHHPPLLAQSVTTSKVIIAVVLMPNQPEFGTMVLEDSLDWQLNRTFGQTRRLIRLYPFTYSYILGILLPC